MWDFTVPPEKVLPFDELPIICNDDDSVDALERSQQRQNCCPNVLFLINTSLLMFSDFLVPFSVYPVIADLVVDFGVVSTKADSGFFVGLVSLLPAIAQAFSSIVLTHFLPSRLGIRPIVIASLFLQSIFSFLLAFSSNFVYYLLIRILMGITNGGYPLAFLAVGRRKELTRPWVVGGFAMMNTFTCLSFAVGSLLGGFLGRPVQQYQDNLIPFLGEPGPLREFLVRFPLFAVYAVVGIVYSAVFVYTLILFRDPMADEVLGNHVVVGSGGEESQTGALLSSVCGEDEKNDGRMVFVEDDNKKKEKGRFCRCCGSGLCSVAPILVLILVVLLRGVTMFSSATIPLLLSYSRPDGGYGLTNYEIGIYGWFDAAFAAVFSAAFPVLQCLNMVWLFRFASLLYIPFLVFYPEIRHLSGVYLWLVLVAVTCGRQFFRQTISTIVMILCTNAVLEKDLSLMQAVAGFVGYLGGGVGPYLGGVFVGIGSNVMRFPADVCVLRFFLTFRPNNKMHLPLIVASGGLIASSIVAFCLSPSLHSRKTQSDESDNKEEDAVEAVDDVDKPPSVE